MSGRKLNVGRRDRIVRAVLTPIALVGAVWLYVPSGSLGIAAIAGLVVLAFILGASAITGTCGIYSVLGIDTCGCEDEYAGGNTWGG